MGNKGSDIVTLIMACVIVAMGFYITQHPNNNDYNSFERKIDSLDITISRLETEHIAKDSLLNTYKQELDSINIEKRAVEKEINDIRIFYGKAIRDISKLSTAQLDSFFTARYSHTRL